MKTKQNNLFKKSQTDLDNHYNQQLRTKSKWSSLLHITSILPVICAKKHWSVLRTTERAVRLHWCEPACRIRALICTRHINPMHTYTKKKKKCPVHVKNKQHEANPSFSSQLKTESFNLDCTKLRISPNVVSSHLMSSTFIYVFLTASCLQYK